MSGVLKNLLQTSQNISKVSLRLLNHGSWCYVNPPFRHSDGAFGAGPTAFVRKAIAEKELGKSSVIVIPTMSFINLLLEAGAECRSMGRVHWIDTISGDPWKSPSCITCFILRAK